MHKGIVAPLLLVILAVLFLSGGSYVYFKTSFQKSSTDNPLKEKDVFEERSITFTSLKNKDNLIAGQTYKITWKQVGTFSPLVRITAYYKVNLEPAYRTTYLVPVWVKQLPENAEFSWDIQPGRDLGPNSGNGSYLWTLDPSMPKGSYVLKITADWGWIDTPEVSDETEISVLSETLVPPPFKITSVSPNIIQEFETKNAQLRIFGSNLNNGIIVFDLKNNATGEIIWTAGSSNPHQNSSDNTPLYFTVLNTIPTGSYELRIRDPLYGRTSNPYLFTITPKTP